MQYMVVAKNIGRTLLVWKNMAEVGRQLTGVRGWQVVLADNLTAFRERDALPDLSSTFTSMASRRPIPTGPRFHPSHHVAPACRRR